MHKIEKQKYLFSAVLFHIVLEVLASELRPENEIKDIQMEREEHLFANNMIAHIENIDTGVVTKNSCN